jgi:CBS domain-containing protein
MKARELCIRNVVTATANESVVDAARRIAESHVGDLINHWRACRRCGTAA